MAAVIHTNTAQLVIREASEGASERASKSYIISPKKYNCIPRISHKGLVLGNHLASGSFNDVYEVKEIRAGHAYQQETDSEDTAEACPADQEQHQNSVPLTRVQDILTNGNNRYVVKFLSRNVVSDLSAFRTGSTDLSLEAQYLASLDHPNIITLRGVADNVMDGLLAGFGGGYFLLLDRLHCTLEQRIAKWHHQQQKARLPFRKKRSDKKDNFAKRLHIVAELSEALRYLHSLGIVYRDLKPENVGFRSDGKLKLFDFGLAKELHPSERLADDLYRMTGSTGSLRYMAPEVGRNMPYGLSADVYSLSILMWELCSLQQPYDGMSRESHAELVLYGQFRPQINSEWSDPIKKLLTDGWSEDIQQRPQMETFQNVLNQEIRNALALAVSNE